MDIIAIKDKIIILKKNKYVKILKIEPINLNLKSQNETDQIFESYNEFLKSTNINFQIVIKNKKINLSSHIKYLSEIPNYLNNELKKSYIDHIEKLINFEYVYEKVFYLIYSINAEKGTSFNKVADEFETINETINENFKKMGNVIQDVFTDDYDNNINVLTQLMKEKDL